LGAKIRKFKKYDRVAGKSWIPSTMETISHENIQE